LVVRVKLRLSKNSKSIDVVALVNTGYEADTPQLIIPISIARRLNLWPPPANAREAIFDTAGGPLRVWIIPQLVKAKIITPNAESKEVTIDVVISPLADEPLISDLLADELGIAIESPGKGLWRFRWEPPSKVRESEKKTIL